MILDKVITVSGLKPGKIVTVMGGVHGTEDCGVLAIKRAISELKIENGRVNFIFGNPAAIQKKIRFTEMNLNRAFRPESMLSQEESKTYERRRALEIMEFLKESDALLDIHSSETPASQPFIICEPHSFEIARRLPFKIISYGWDAIEPGGSDYFMNSMGRIGICIECGYNKDLTAPEKAFESIRDFLSICGVIKGAIPDLKEDQRFLHAGYIYRTQTNFAPYKFFTDFEMITEGQLIGRDGIDEVRAVKTGYILFCRKRESPDQEAFIIASEVEYNN